MSDIPPLVIPHAGAGPFAQPTLPGLRLPQLEKLLARLRPAPRDTGSEDSLSPPHERARARALGLQAPDGQLPWAALQAAERGLDRADSGAWAFITPCHWQLASAHVDMDDPQDLQLTEAESRALLAAMQPYFAEDGIALHYVAPTTWLACGEWFRGLATASLDRVAGRCVDDWMPRAAQARGLRRLQNEMQMLLYTHTVNDARSARGLMPVNSFWASGTGALPSPAPAATSTPPTLPRGLADAARRQDPAAWAAAWQHIDATDCAALLQALARGQQVQLTLCGERHAQSFGNGAPGVGGWAQKISSVFRPLRTSDVLEQL